MIKIIKELIASTQNVIIERIKSPLLSSFGLFWIFFNWKLPLILILSDKDIEAKIAKIDSLANLSTGFIYPLIGAAFYAGAYPLINYYLFKFHQKYEKDAEMQKTENACEVLEKKVKLAQLESKLDQTKFNAEKRLEKEKIENEYRLEESKLELEEKKIQLQHQLNQKQKEVAEQAHSADAPKARAADA